jgi:hypothetical protein
MSRAKLIYALAGLVREVRLSIEDEREKRKKAEAELKALKETK